MQIGANMDSDEPGPSRKHPFAVVLAQIPGAGLGQTLFSPLIQMVKEKKD